MKTKISLFVSLVLIIVSQIYAQNISDSEISIKYVDIVHTTHTDYGYTDNPVIVVELQKRYLDIALDLALESKNNPAGERFCWTAEVLDISTYTGWISLDSASFRLVNFKSVKDMKTGAIAKLYTSSNKRFWLSDLQPNTSRQFELLTTDIQEVGKTTSIPELTLDSKNWISSVKYQGMTQPLFADGLANFMALQINEDVFNLMSYHNMPDSVRMKQVAAVTKEIWATPASEPSIVENGYSYIFSQVLEHPLLTFFNRTVEVYKEIPRVKVKVQFERKSLLKPEMFYLTFPLPEEAKPSLTSNGGVPFVPYMENLPNSCKDFFTIDSWVKFSSDDGSRIWSSVDVPLVNFGGHNLCSHIKDAPKNSNILYAMLYNNTWCVDFDS